MKRNISKKYPTLLKCSISVSPPSFKGHTLPNVSALQPLSQGPSGSSHGDDGAKGKRAATCLPANPSSFESPSRPRPPQLALTAFQKETPGRRSALSHLVRRRGHDLACHPLLSGPSGGTPLTLSTCFGTVARDRQGLLRHRLWHDWEGTPLLSLSLSPFFISFCLLAWVIDRCHIYTCTSEIYAKTSCRHHFNCGL